MWIMYSDVPACTTAPAPVVADQATTTVLFSLFNSILTATAVCSLFSYHSFHQPAVLRLLIVYKHYHLLL